MKRIMSFFLLIALFTLNFGSYNVVKGKELDPYPLSDIYSASFSGAINYILQKKMASGYSDGTFKPNNPITRAEMLKIAIGSNFDLSKYQPGDAKCSNDIEVSDWPHIYVCFAKEQGVVQGYEDGSFRPRQSVTYAEALKIVYKSSPIISHISLSTPGLWYEQYLNIVKDFGEVLGKTGVNNSFSINPNEYITREQMAQLILSKDQMNHYYKVEDSGNKYNMPILVLGFVPQDPDNPQYIDSKTTGINSETTVSEIKERIDYASDGIKRILTEGTRYKGKGDPLLKYNIVDKRIFEEPTPLGACVSWKTCSDRREGSWYRPDYKKILSDNKYVNICDYVDNKNVKEVWMFSYHGGQTEVMESNMSMGLLSINKWPQKSFNINDSFGDISNSERTNDLPICDKTYSVFNYNYDRLDTGGDSAENHMHQFESIFMTMSSDLYHEYIGPYNEYKNPNTKDNPYRCGWMHYTPNSTGDYDWANTTNYVWTDCFDWTPDKTGRREYVNCDKWECRAGPWVILWMQSVPGKDNGLIYKGKPIRNWWDFIADFDNATNNRPDAGQGLY